jgi:hypothetical protein
MCYLQKLPIPSGEFVSAIPLKKEKFKVKNQEAINSHKKYQRFISR